MEYSVLYICPSETVIPSEWLTHNLVRVYEGWAMVHFVGFQHSKLELSISKCCMHLVGTENSPVYQDRELFAEKSLFRKANRTVCHRH